MRKTSWYWHDERDTDGEEREERGRAELVEDAKALAGEREVVREPPEPLAAGRGAHQVEVVDADELAARAAELGEEEDGGAALPGAYLEDARLG